MSGEESMVHPFFDTVAFPWDRPEAGPFHEALYLAIPDPDDVDRLYKSCGHGLKPFVLSQGADDLWKAALERLTEAGALRVLCDKLLTAERYQSNGVFVAAVTAVVTATDPGGGGRRRITDPRRWPGWLAPALVATVVFVVLVGGWRLLRPSPPIPPTEPTPTPPTMMFGQKEKLDGPPKGSTPATPATGGGAGP